MNRDYSENLPSPLFAKEGIIPPLGKGRSGGILQINDHIILRLSIYWLLFLLSIFLALPVYASGDFRCDGRIVSPGDRMFEVLASCGEPAFRSARFEKRIRRDFFRDLFPPKEPRESEKFREPRFVEEIVEIEEWVYNFGSTQFIRFLTFENGILVNIETGDYGY